MTHAEHEVRRAIDLLRRAMQIANRAVIADIESEAVRVHDMPGGRWYDVRPMLDAREHPPESIDMANEALRYAQDCGLVRTHPEHEHLVRVLP